MKQSLPEILGLSLQDKSLAFTNFIIKIKLIIIMMKGMLMKTVLFILTLLLSTISTAAGPILASTPKNKKSQTSLNLYVESQEAAKFLNANKSAILIDVRTPEEVMFTGSATRTNIHVPIFLVNQSKYNQKKQSYEMIVNENFRQELTSELKRVKTTMESDLFIMCRSGSSRSPIAVEIAKSIGYKKVYSVLNGFEGSKSKNGNIGARTVSGWKNSGFKWGYKSPENVLWFKDKYKQ